MRRKRLMTLLSLSLPLSLSACQYSWAFGEDTGASGIKLFADSVCTKELATSLYTPQGKKDVQTSFDNQFFFPGEPGQTYWVHGFHSEASCESARKKIEGKPRPKGLQGKETRY